MADSPPISPTDPSSARRFRIAFSFAGEKRVLIEQVAEILSKCFSRDAILYDKFHEAEFARSDLGIYLPNLYNREVDLVVVVVCPQYDVKEWTGLEWLAIHDLLRRCREKVLLCRFEQTQVDGLFSGAGFIELDRKTHEQFARVILERLALNEGRPKDYYSGRIAGDIPRSAANIPNNNLPRQQFFFGRMDELKRIAESLSAEARGWGALIDGPGGIGKTALAIRAAELVPTGRFHRIVFLSAKERELTADGQRALGHFVLPSYLEMLNAIAREIAQPDLAKSPEVERSDSILHALRESDVLLVLDNLETLPETDRDQLFAFLNRLPRGCSAIVTSRRRADVGAVSIRLDRLDWEAACELFSELGRKYSELGQASDTDRRALYEDTGGSPLLIRWVVGQLGRGHYRTVTEALALLRSPEAGNNPLEFVFGDLLDTFSRNETKVLAALTHFSLPTSVRHLAELAGINEEAAQGALADLSQRALVLPDLEERCFLIVPLVADYLRRMQPEVIQETSDRLEKRAYALVVENGYEKHDRFRFLDAAWPNIAAALPSFLAGTNKRLQTICDGLQKFLQFSGRWDEQLALSKQAEAKSVAVEDFLNAGWRAYDAGNVHRMRGLSGDVFACADRVDSHWREAGVGARERAVALQLRGLGHQLAKNYPAAIAAYRNAVKLDRSLNRESDDVAIDLSTLADVERHSGDFAGAERDYREALRIARVVGHDEQIAEGTGNLAALALDLEDWPKAEKLARRALTLSERLQRQELIATACNYLARSLLEQGEKDEALPYARRAVEIYQKLGTPDLAAARQVVAECEGNFSQ
jgi:tetratricopeptide (TPR) repeat protein